VRSSRPARYSRRCSPQRPAPGCWIPPCR
jgi:hypothetical protein